MLFDENQIMHEDEGDNWLLYAKTGFSGNIGWYVGWVQTVVDRCEKIYIFVAYELRGDFADVEHIVDETDGDFKLL